MTHQKKFVKLVLIFLITTSCQRLSLQGEEMFIGRKNYYSFNPDTILSDIARGNTNIFLLQTFTPLPPLSHSLNAVRWDEGDFFDIAQALYKFAGNETIEGWSIRHASFNVKCEDVIEGPQSAHFIFYKVVETHEKESRFERRINIDSSNGSASWFEYEFSPNLVQQHPIDLSKHGMSIIDVLQVAEKNGGKEIRTSVSNNCLIDVEAARGGGVWRVSYVETLDLFAIDIDALTGEYEIISQGAK